MTTLVWLRRDLRIFDNTALQTAIKCGQPIVVAFVFDANILQTLPTNDRRLSFIYESLQELQQALQAKHIPLWVAHDCPQQWIPHFAQECQPTQVICAEDYEPYAMQRDQQVAYQLASLGINFQQVTDQAIFSKATVLNQQGKPYTVFTPYKKKWLKQLHTVYDQLALNDNWSPLKNTQEFYTQYHRYPLPDLASLGFTPQQNRLLGGESHAKERLADFLPRLSSYHQLRDYPAKKGVSYLSVYLRFGLLSIRHLVRICLENSSQGSDTWLSELIWREFYQQLLWHFPHVVQRSFKEQYAQIAWQNDRTFFDAWC